MKKAVVNPDFKIYASCPECDEFVDLLVCESNNQDGVLLNPLTNNKWDEIIGLVVTCPVCDKEFEIESVEY